jgi:hypothetical protein
MPSPSQADLHVNAPLTNVSIAYLQSASTYIADKVFPKVPVQKQSDLYWKYSKSDWRRTDVKRRAPGTETPGSGWNMNTDSYFAHVYGIHKDIDDQLRSNADSNFNLDRDATEFITNQLLLQRDIDWNAKYFTTGVWATDKTGGTDFVKWSDAGSDPISDVADIVVNFRKLTGFKPNICVMGADVMKALKQHPDIIDRIKYTQKGIVSEDLIATLFDVDEMYTSYATAVGANGDSNFGSTAQFPDFAVSAGVNVVVTTTGSASSGSTAFTLTAADTRIIVGMPVSGTGIATGTTVAAVSGTSVTLSANTTAAISTGSVTFGTAGYDFITNSKAVLFAYAPSGPSLMTPSAGYTFTWNGYLGGNSQGIKVKRFRMEHIASDRVEAEMTYDMKVVAADLGYYLTSAVA